MQQQTSKLRSLITTAAVVVIAYTALTWGRSWSLASHEDPSPVAGEAVWIATFNGL
ncbi:MAG: hypothetical protein VX913_14835 [Planctomycetota bacterium]|nr:hypothetical protein [Planctomycetota bacterium]